MSFELNSNKNKLNNMIILKIIYGVPNEIRTRVTAVKGRCPRPLDDGDSKRERLNTFTSKKNQEDNEKLYEPHKN